MEQIEKQFITSYQSILAKKGKEICKEVESIFDDNDELMKEKANTYCQFISSFKVDGVDPKLVERCQNYIDDVIRVFFITKCFCAIFTRNTNASHIFTY